jgi:hypothetical protein
VNSRWQKDQRWVDAESPDSVIDLYREEVFAP